MIINRCPYCSGKLIHGYKFVAFIPHACVWDESHISLDKYLEK